MRTPINIPAFEKHSCIRGNKNSWQQNIRKTFVHSWQQKLVATIHSKNIRAFVATKKFVATKIRGNNTFEKHSCIRGNEKIRGNKTFMATKKIRSNSIRLLKALNGAAMFFS